MRYGSLRKLIQLCWNNDRGSTFSDLALYNRLLVDGGLDAEELSEKVITELLEEKRLNNWSQAAFACSELTAFYLALAEKMSVQQVAAAVFSACVLADAARANECDWSMEHSKIVRLCGIIDQRISVENSILFMRYLFGKEGHG